jgi:hypothetical protein
MLIKECSNKTSPSSAFRSLLSMPLPVDPDKISENIEFIVQELLEAPADHRTVMLEQIAKSLTRRLLRDHPGIGIREISTRVTQFVAAVRQRLGEEEERLQEE